MRKIAICVVAALLSLTVAAPSSYSQTLLDTGMPSKLVQIGARMGFNTSNLSTNFDEAYPEIAWNHSQWGQGFAAGAVVDINLRNYIAIQSGLNFRSRNSSFHYLVNDANELTAIDGKWGGYYFEIPLLLSFRLGVAELGQLHIDAGPYWATGFGGKCHYTYFSEYAGSVVAEKAKGDYFGKNGIANRSDWGFKFGVGILVMQHYYIGAHYNAGARNIMRDTGDGVKKPSGHNKIWSFTVGYNF